jgi:hypothetical protein
VIASQKAFNAFLRPVYEMDPAEFSVIIVMGGLITGAAAGTPSIEKSKKLPWQL